MTDIQYIQNPEYEEPKVLWPHISGNGTQREETHDETSNSLRFNYRELLNAVRRLPKSKRRCGLCATFAIIFGLCFIHSVFIFIAFQRLWKIEPFLETANPASKPLRLALLKGSIVDAESGFNMSNVTVTATPLNHSHLDGIVQTKSLHNGEFRVLLTTNITYDLSFNYVGYRNVDMMITFLMNQEVSLPPILMINKRFEGTGMAGGQVVNSNTSKPEGNVRVELREGFQNTSRNIVGTTTTGANGMWEVHLSTGYYTAVLSKPGYASAITSVTILGGLQRGNHYTTLSRNFVAHAVQFILEWTSSSCKLEPTLFHQNGLITIATVCQRQETNSPFALACLRKSMILDNQLPGAYRYVVEVAKREAVTTTTSTTTKPWQETEEEEGGVYISAELRKKRGWYESEFQFDWSECGAEVSIFIDGVLRGSYVMPAKTGRQWTVAAVDGDQLVFVNSADL